MFLFCATVIPTTLDSRRDTGHVSVLFETHPCYWRTLGAELSVAFPKYGDVSVRPEPVEGRIPRSWFDKLTTNGKIAVIVIGTGPRPHEVGRLLPLSRHEETDAVNRSAVGMVRMRIGVHLVLTVATVDEAGLRTKSRVGLSGSGRSEGAVP